MAVLRQILNQIESLENKNIILESKIEELNKKISILNTVEKIPESQNHTAINPYAGGVVGEGEGLDTVNVEESSSEISDVLTNEVTLSSDGTILTFKKRPAYAIYYPDEEA